MSYNYFITIIIPNYNHSSYLKQRIDSVLSQTYRDFEVIILDDKSTDDSRSVIDAYAGNEKVSHIVYNTANSGSTFIQWERGFELAKGDLIWIAESDDYCEPSFLETMVQYFRINERLSFAFCTSNIVDSFGNPCGRDDISAAFSDFVLDGKKFIRRYMLRGNSVWNASAVLFRKDLALSIDKSYMNYKSAGDHLFWVELAEHGAVAHSPLKLNYFRQHDNKVTPRKVREGITFKEEHTVLEYIQNKKLSNLFAVTGAECSFIVRILKGEFNTFLIKSDLLDLWGYKGWMHLTLLKIASKILK